MSIEQFKKAIVCCAEEAPAHNNLGLSFSEAEMFDEALEAFHAAITREQADVTKNNLSPENLAFYHKNRGLAYYHQAELEESKFDFDRAIELVPNSAMTYFNRGNVLLDLGEFKSAHDDFDKAIELNNSNAKFYHGKGLTFQAQAEKLAQNKDFPFEEHVELIN